MDRKKKEKMLIQRGEKSKKEFGLRFQVGCHSLSVFTVDAGKRREGGILKRIKWVNAKRRGGTRYDFRSETEN